MENTPAKPIFEHPQSQSPLPIGFSAITVESLQDQITDLQTKLSSLISSHQHNGNMSTRVNFDTDIIGLYETVSVAPTGKPTSPYGQIKFYSNSTTYRMYMYDGLNNVWRYATLT